MKGLKHLYDKCVACLLDMINLEEERAEEDPILKVGKPYVIAVKEVGVILRVISHAIYPI